MSLSAWEKVLSTYTGINPNQVTEAAALFEETGAFGSNVIRNLLNDRFLSDIAAKEFIDLFLRYPSASSDLPAFKKDFIKLCLDNSLCGGEIGLRPYPKRIGRAHEKSAFIHNISTSNSEPAPRIQRMLAKLEKGTLNSSQRSALSALKINEDGAWVTWDLTSSGDEHPFKFSTDKCAYDVRCALGLPITNSMMHNRPLLVIDYLSHSVGTLYRPTTADAAAHLRFEVRQPPPPPESDWYGLTVPWQDDPKGKRPSDFGLFPPKMPEALHDKLNFPDPIGCETYHNKI